MTAFNLLHYICYIFQSHCFLVNILLYIVRVYILYKMKRKTETKIQSKYQLFCCFTHHYSAFLFLSC